jgi:predicted nucleotidyltransferase
MSERSSSATVSAPTLAMLRARREEVLRLAASYGASNVRVYGSVARGEAGPDSDIDLLVDFEAGRSLVDEVELQIQLAALLGWPVDVGEEVHASIRDRVNRETVRL